MPIQPPSQQTESLSIIVTDLQTYVSQAAATSFEKYAKAHPKLTPHDALDQWLLVIQGTALGNAVAGATSQLGQNLQQFANAVPAINPASGLGGSDWQHLLIRTAEFGIGGILIAVGIAAIVAGSKAGQTVINVGENIVPAGRAAKATGAARRSRIQGASRPGFTEGGIND